jgi:putative intracellular protease/amidase
MTLETSMNDLPPAVAQAKSGSKTKKPSDPKSQPLSLRVRQHRIMVHTLLKHLGMIDPALNVNQLAGRRRAPDKTWVAIYDAGGTGGPGVARVEQILGEAGMQVVRMGPAEIAAGSLSQFDLVVVPGGSGSAEAKALGLKGRQEIKRFVEGGGGYLGICAGAFLAASGYDWSLGLLDAKTVSPLWNRGGAMVKMELTPEGRKILGDRPGVMEVRYHNGPILTRANLDNIPDYEVLALFRSEVAKNGTPVGVMINAPAILTGRFGKGRVVCSSPHPEQTQGLQELIRYAAVWAAGKTK